MKLKSSLTKEETILVEKLEKDPKGYNFFKKTNLLNKLKERMNPEKTFLINMELRNGSHTTFMISTKKVNFKFLGGEYIIDTNLKYYNINSKSWCLDYHQDISLPIKRTIPVRDIQKAFKDSVAEVENAINPSTLENFVESKIAEGIMKGQQIDEFFKQIKMLILIGVAASVIHLLLFVFKTGMLKSVSIPGL